MRGWRRRGTWDLLDGEVMEAAGVAGDETGPLEAAGVAGDAAGADVSLSFAEVENVAEAGPLHSAGVATGASARRVAMTDAATLSSLSAVTSSPEEAMERTISSSESR